MTMVVCRIDPGQSQKVFFCALFREHGPVGTLTLPSVGMGQPHTTRTQSLMLGNTLAIHWQYTGNTLAIHWQITGNTLAIYYLKICLSIVLQQ